MPVMHDSMPEEGFEISPRFRRSLEERIARLEQGADFDEAQLPYLQERDHIRRQLHLIVVQRAEALRMRLFLDRAGTRPARRLGVGDAAYLDTTAGNREGMVE